VSPEQTPCSDPEAPATRERLLDAAERLFADRGFEATSVRDITAAAGCNVAAVNYHFGGKDKLYLEVFRRLLGELREQRMQRIRSDMETAGSGLTLELFLESFTRSFLEPLSEGSRSRHLMKLWDREMHNRHLPAGVFLDELIRPMMRVNDEALAVVAPSLDAVSARLSLMSVVGQLIHALKVKQMIEEGEGAGLVPADIETIVRHVVRFSAAGVRACAEEAR
jgi:AcrR family transcriptional regulator